ncbi:hypothetical protein P2T68_16830 [Pseudomonas sp. G11]|uniref:hypothetical protein n=1 Tax=Pseudomonas sp. G11 TaxID=528343 RepID=UPI0024028FA3|nr:hypothetical protein [Pseudomonas sp. G11]WEX18909.1 hypothetical protein P2T68_16830 [Pseudomonas sp. G11]
MSIDWSKAPYDAEAGYLGASETYDAWYRRDGIGQVQQICPGAGIYVWTWMGGRADFPAGAELRPVAKPEWAGEGLPPVGIEIEAMLPALGSARFWQIAKVVHGPLPESPGEILVFSLENTKPSWVDQFRPIRTPEQIAAEERDLARTEILNAMTADGRTEGENEENWQFRMQIVGEILDMGYRKQAPQ